MKYKEVFRQTPNVNKDRLIVPIGIVLHHTAGSYAGSVSWCLNADSKVAYHCIVNINGDRTVLAKSNQRAWHSGKSIFKGKSDCNSFMLGIAVSGDTNIRILTESEIDSVAEWCVEQMSLYNIPIDNITTHRHISPNRKNDVDSRSEQSIKNKIKEKLAALNYSF